MDNTFTFIIADDNPVDRFLHAKIVSEAGFDVIGLAEDGDVLIELIHNIQPDFILCDIFMPKLNGIEALVK